MGLNHSTIRQLALSSSSPPPTQTGSGNHGQRAEGQRGRFRDGSHLKGGHRAWSRPDDRVSGAIRLSQGNGSGLRHSKVTTGIDEQSRFIADGAPRDRPAFDLKVIGCSRGVPLQRWRSASDIAREPGVGNYQNRSHGALHPIRVRAEVQTAAITKRLDVADRTLQFLIVCYM